MELFEYRGGVIFQYYGMPDFIQLIQGLKSYTYDF